MQKAGEGRRTMTTVLDPKRSNAINIGLTTLPPVHVIKAALLNFDEFAVSKDGIEVGSPSYGCGREVWPSPLVGRHFLSLQWWAWAWHFCRAVPRLWGLP